MNSTMDSFDLDHFPCLSELSQEERCGVTQAEVLLHVLEERLLMKHMSYEEAHLRCFSVGSYQNRYREEHRLESTVSNCVV